MLFVCFVEQSAIKELTKRKLALLRAGFLERNVGHCVLAIKFFSRRDESLNMVVKKKENVNILWKSRFYQLLAIALKLLINPLLKLKSTNGGGVLAKNVRVCIIIIIIIFSSSSSEFATNTFELIFDDEANEAKAFAQDFICGSIR